MVCLLLIAFMVAVGGYTRLSGSGLSMTDWHPIHGVIPPMDTAEWEEEFAAYQQSPQGRTTNAGISLEEFKTIFWPEYWHRILGRVIGVVFLMPLVVFGVRKSISRRFGLRLLAIFALGGLQGLAGWYMVASGLVNDPHVSHLRLAIHLSLAFILFALILWALLDVLHERKNTKAVPSVVQFWYKGWLALLCVQIILGAFVAGLKAGLIYNTWPTMNGVWLPAELWGDAKPWHENIALVQFLHRKTAILVALGFGLWWFFARHYVKNNALIKQVLSAAIILLVQFKLGILTLIKTVPLNLALAHQLVGLALFAVAVWLLYGISHARDEKAND